MEAHDDQVYSWPLSLFGELSFFFHLPAGVQDQFPRRTASQRSQTGNVFKRVLEVGGPVRRGVSLVAGYRCEGLSPPKRANDHGARYSTHGGSCGCYELRGVSAADG